MTLTVVPVQTIGLFEVVGSADRFLHICDGGDNNQLKFATPVRNTDEILELNENRDGRWRGS
jgi:hypothetical protein